MSPWLIIGPVIQKCWPLFLLFFAVLLFKAIIERLIFQINRRLRKAYYNNDYLKSEAWQRKRALVFKRDGHRCVLCGRRATQVHHKRYARRNIGREPIDWLISICDDCHRKQHGN